MPAGGRGPLTPAEILLETAVTDAPANQAWFGPGGAKLITEAWQRYGYDSPAIRNAADWQFATTPAETHGSSNYPSVQPHLEWMGQHFDQLLAQGLTEQYDPASHGSKAEFAAVVNPLHVVSKADGSLRPILDPTNTGVNACMEPLPCPLPALGTLLHNLPANGYLGKRDLASGFHHVKLAPAARRYMAFRHPVTNALQRWVVLPFGASQSPPIFVELTSAARDIFQAECDRLGLQVRIYVYVDDFMLLGRTHADVVGAFGVLDRIGAELGLEWKLSKDQGRDTPLQQLELLGMLFDTVSMEMRIAPQKRARYATDVQTLLSEASATAARSVQRTALHSVVGKLTFLARACRWGPAFLQSLYDALYHPGSIPPRRATLSPAAVEDLQWWERLLGTSGSPWDGVSRCVVSDINLVRGEFLGPDGAVVFTDASGKGFGAAWDEAEVQGAWGESEAPLHIAWRELTAVLRALETWAPSLSGRRVLIRCDNTQAVAAVAYGSTRVPEGRPIARRIAELAVQHGFEVRAEHVAGVDNGRADRLSRQLTAGRDQDLRLRPCTFRQLRAAAKLSPEVDCCCDAKGANRQPGCSAYYSGSNSVIGREQELAGRVLWAFPPWALVGEVLDTVLRARQLDQGTQAVVLVPRFEERAWFRRLVRPRTSPFRVLRVLGKGGSWCLTPWGAPAGPSPFDLLALTFRP